MAVYGTNQGIPEDYFSNIILKVKKTQKGWEKTVTRILNNVHGVRDFYMGPDGEVQVAGMIYPTQLLAALHKAGSKLEVKSWKYGQCSRHLEIPNAPKKKALEYNRHGFGLSQEYPPGGYPYPGYGFGQSYEYPGYGYGIPVCDYQSQDSSQCRCIQAKNESSSVEKSSSNASQTVKENVSNPPVPPVETSEMPVCCTIM